MEISYNPLWLRRLHYALTPYFSISNTVWLEQGGIYAVANIRGGEEYGEEWHQAG